MSKARIHAVDQKILERIVAAPIESDASEHEADPLSFEEMEPYLALIPPREVDLLEMHTKKKKQKEIAMFFSITQGAVSHRLARARQRLLFLRDMPKIEDHTLMQQLREVLPQQDAEVTFYMIRTTCQSKTATILNERGAERSGGRLTQVKVRHKFRRAVVVLEERAQEFPKYSVTADLSRYVLDRGLYMLHEVKLSHFCKGDKVQIDMTGAL